MPLTLRIISKQKDLLGSDSTKVFSVHGGTIGRAPDNDWILPDPDRYISAHHAIIDYQAGAYFLTDTSSNGVYVNDSDQSVGSGAPIRLHNGDRIRMGRYRFAVSIVNVGRDGTGDTGVFATEDDEDGPSDETTTQPSLRVEGLGLNLELVDEAQTRQAPEDEPSAEDQFTIIEAVPDTLATRALSPGDLGATGEIASPIDQTAETQPVEALQKAALRASLVALLEAAGADPDRLPEGVEAEFLARLGQVVRAAVAGLAGAFVTTDRPAQPPDVDSLTRNPLHGGDDSPRALNELLFYEGLDYPAPVDAVDEAVADLQAHQMAVTRAGRAAWLDLLDRVAPATLEASFNKGLTRGSLLGISNKAKYWDLYREFYEQLARRADEQFGTVFEETYRRIYQAERDRRTFREEKQSTRTEPSTPKVKIPD